MLRREPHRLLFPLGALLAWSGVLPWLFFSLGLRKLYAPVIGILVYRSFLHPLAELEGFLTCLAAGAGPAPAAPGKGALHPRAGPHRLAPPARNFFSPPSLPPPRSRSPSACAPPSRSLWWPRRGRRAFPISLAASPSSRSGFCP